MKRSLSIVFIAGILLGGAIIFYGSPDTALMDPDEARYAEASKEMIEHKSYIVPLYNGEPRLNKPILFYWFQIASFRLFGVNEFAARFPSMLAGLGCILMLFFIARLLFRDDTAIMSIFIFISNLFFFAFSKLGTLDIVLLFFFTMSLFLFLKAERYATQGMMRTSDLLIALLALSLGLSFLTKGPVGIIVPVLVIVLYLLFMRRSMPFSWKNALLSILVFLVVVVPWGVSLIWKVGISDILSLLKRETTERYFVGFDHPQPFYFFILIFFAGFFPWSSFIPCAVYRRIRSSFREKNGTDLFLLVWLIFPIIFFSFSGSKLPGYILPVIVPASVMVASEWMNLIKMKVPRKQKQGAESESSIEEDARGEIWFFVIGFSILVALLLIYLFAGYKILDRLPQFRVFYLSTFVMSTLFLVSISILSIFKRRLSLFSATAAFFILFLFAINFFAMAQLQKMRSTKELVLEKISSYQGYRLVSYRYNIPSLIFYSGNRFEFSDNEVDLKRIAGESEKTLVVVSEKNYQRLSEETKAAYVVDGEWNEFMLLVPGSKGRP